MGKTDACTKEYISNPLIFADAFNYYFFHGKQVVKPEELTVQDATELRNFHCFMKEKKELLFRCKNSVMS